MGKKRKIDRHGWDDYEYEMLFEIVHDLASCCTGLLLILALWSFSGGERKAETDRRERKLEARKSQSRLDQGNSRALSITLGALLYITSVDLSVSIPRTKMNRARKPSTYRKKLIAKVEEA